MTVLLALLSKFGIPIAALASIPLLLALIFFRVELSATRAELSREQKAVATATTNLATCNSNYQTISDAEAAQERAIQGLKTASDAKVAQLTRAAVAASKARAAAEATVARIQALSPAGNQSCPAVDSLIAGASQ